MKKVVLYIDTSSNQEIIVGLTIDGKKYEKKEKIGKQKAQVVLPLIDQLLKKHKLFLSDISHIDVHPGPGSYTGLRVGVSIANALSYVLHVPVNKEKLGTFVDPRY